MNIKSQKTELQHAGLDTLKIVISAFPTLLSFKLSDGSGSLNFLPFNSFASLLSSGREWKDHAIYFWPKKQPHKNSLSSLWQLLFAVSL